MTLSVALLAVITAIGAFLRLWRLDLAQFRGDDFTVSSLAIGIAHGSFPTGVTSSIGINNGPAAPFILAIPAIVSSNHDWLALAVGLLNTVAIPIMYLLGSRLFG